MEELKIDASHASLEPSEESLRRSAVDVFGSTAVAEAWFERPAVALNHRRPSDLMETAADRELVRTILGRMDFGVYT